MKLNLKEKLSSWEEAMEQKMGILLGIFFGSIVILSLLIGIYYFRVNQGGATEYATPLAPTPVSTQEIVITATDDNNSSDSSPTSTPSLNPTDLMGTHTEDIAISTPEDISLKRNKLMNYIWGGKGIPTSKSLDIIEQVHDEQYDPLFNQEGNLSRIDLYKVKMQNGLESWMYHFIPIEANNKLFIYHSGHRGTFKWEDQQNNGGEGAGLVIPELIKEKFSVIAISMPINGNNIPLYNSLTKGLLALDSHDSLFNYLIYPFSYFIDPVFIAINYAQEKFNYSEINMVGLSGGGWTTTIVAALEPRIIHSYSVAGSIPLPYRTDPRDQGADSEQIDSRFYQIANYSELYVMDSYGKNRSHTQILNEKDPECFGGWSQPHDWVEKVQTTITKLGEGEYSYYLDETTDKHVISEYALSLVLGK